MIDPGDADDYVELGDVVSIYHCPECDADLRIEFRADMPAHAIGLACPHGHVGIPIRVRDPARLDEAFESRHPPMCWECSEEVHSGDHPSTKDGYPLHSGECTRIYHEQMDRLELLQGDSA
ncbi:hypothetical protein [Natrinema halophilum]|uniref:Uncharacterized protein n=1 Tax=Natrinema halophilum TaxID=1699371 RepID=A0A7D5GR44_9EURY|nr:hypothetical protein [Natrinema halophilum]QLG47866.1 hypothetical protein HYG82_02905 [Natrinema halophilum]